MGKDSVPAAIYAAWERELKESVRDRLMPADARRLLAARAVSTTKLIGWLTAPDGRFGARPAAGRDAAAAPALDRAVAELTRRLGPEMDAWRYGQPRLKHVRSGIPLSDAVGPSCGPGWTSARSPAAATAGRSTTPRTTTTRPTAPPSGSSPTWPTGTGRSAPTPRGSRATRTAPITATSSPPGPRAEYFPVAFSRPKVEVGRGGADHAGALTRRPGSGADSGAAPGTSEAASRLAAPAGADPAQYASELITSPKPRVDMPARRRAGCRGHRPGAGGVAVDEVVVIPRPRVEGERLDRALDELAPSRRRSRRWRRRGGSCRRSGSTRPDNSPGGPCWCRC